MEFTVTAAEFVITAEKVARLNARAAKAGIPAVATLVEVSRETKTEVTDLGFERVWTVVSAAITGLENVVLGDWALAAVIDHDVAGNILRTVPGFAVEVPASFHGTSASRCDHCNAVRNRNETILVWNAVEGFKQVGSDCVKLFLGVSPVSLIGFITEAREISEFEGGSWGHSSPSVREFVAAAALVTEVYGFKPSSFEGQSTKTVAFDLISLTGQSRRIFEKDNPKLVAPEAKLIERANALSAESVAWIAANTETSEYIRNLRIAAVRDEVGRNAGLLASLPNAFKRAQGIAIERAAKVELPASEFVGTVGSKVRTTATVVYTNRSEPYSYYGPEGLFVILLGDDGSKFYVNTTVDTVVGILFEDAVKGTVFTVMGTVKAHKVTDKGEKVTTLTRCKAQEV